jgi:hypothetical protein
MKKAFRLEKSVGSFLLEKVFERLLFRFPIPKQPSRPPPADYAPRFVGLAQDANSLFGLGQFRSERQDFGFAGQSAGMLRVKDNLLQVVPYSQAHEVVTRELLAG